MNSQMLFIAPKDTRKLEGNSFTWNLGAGPIHAETTSFALHFFPPTAKYTWFLSASTGFVSTDTWFYFQIGVDYVSDEVMDATYTLEGGFSFVHVHSLPDRPGWVVMVYADRAELTIRLDPKGGTAKGHFIAHFETDGYDMHPTGTFELIRDDMKN